MSEEKNLELEVVESSDGEVTFKVVEEDKVDKAIERMYIEGQQDLFDSDIIFKYGDVIFIKDTNELKFWAHDNVKDLGKLFNSKN